MRHDLMQAGWILLAAAGVSLLLCRAFRRRLPGFRSLEAKPGKEKIHRLFPKPRKPMAGGPAMLSAMLVAVLALARPLNWLLAACLATVALFGLLGLRDDLRKARGSGISERQKLLWQALLGLLFAAYLWRAYGYGTVYVPFAGWVALGPWYLPLGALVLVAASNAVNLTDGIDGLAAGSMAIASLVYLGFGFLLFVPTAAVLAAACLGACVGFLVYNYPPARMIMGDAGALGLGAALGVMALVSRTEWLLLLAGGVFVIDALSVILQTGTIRFFRAPVRLLRHRTSEPFRPFLCTPIHHHFQWLAWPERRILLMFLALGAGLGMLAWAAYFLEWLWVVGLVAMAAFLLAAAAQKVLRGEFFLGLHRAGEGESVLAVFQGAPVEILGRALYRPARITSIPESALPAMAADGLWRAVGEYEADALLGKIHAELKMWDGAVEAWERIPPRNLLLREDVLLQLARIYYARGDLLKAIRLWEELPSGRVERSEQLRGAVRRAKLRLADLAGKAHRQSLRGFRAARASGGASRPEDLVEQLREARRLNQDLFALLVREREQLDLSAAAGGPRSRGEGGLAKAEAPSADAPSADPTQRALFRRMERTVLDRIGEIENALSECEQGLPPLPEPAGQIAPADEATARACAQLGITPQQLAQALRGAGAGPARVTEVQPLAARSRNALFRITLDWSGPASIVVKSYEQQRIAFFQACYLRERGMLEVLGRYGCAVPQVYGGVEAGDRALLFMEDSGRETLADRLTGDEAQRTRELRPAVAALADLHLRTREHLSRLQREVLRVEKEALGLDYYLAAARIALERILELDGETLAPERWAALAEGLRPVAALLAVQPKTFIHFEFTPQHLLVSDGRLTAFDFEQATVGPPEFDLATLLRCPESALSEALIAELAEAYAAEVARADTPPMPHRAPEAFDYAAIIKDVVYAGAAANFHRKFGGEEHRPSGDPEGRPRGAPKGRGRVAWYLGDADALLARYPALAGLRAMLRERFARWLSQPAPSP